MPPAEFAAFLTYASEDEAWARALRENLEKCLAHLGHEPAKVFDPAVDLGAGRSWVVQLDQGLDRAERGILVVTPEALAARDGAQEWESFIPARRGWRPSRLVLAELRATPRR